MKKARFGRIAAFVLFVVASVVPKAVLAEGRPSRVALVRTAATDPLLQETSTRLRAELREAGFEVIDVDSSPGDARSSVESVPDADGDFATIAIDRGQSVAFADVWVSDHLTGKTVVRRVGVRGEKNNAAVLAIRAIELLRASLLEAAVPPPDRPMKAPPDVLHWVEPTISRPTERRDFRRGASLGVGALALHGTSGLGFSFGPTLRLGYGLHGPFIGRLAVAAPLTGPSVDGRGGSASVKQEFVALDLAWVSSTEPVAFLGAVGAGAFHLHTEGSAEAPFSSKSADVVSVSANVSAGALLRLGQRIALTAEATAILLHPSPVIVIAGHDTGTAGAPSMGVSVGVLLAL